VPKISADLAEPQSFSTDNVWRGTQLQEDQPAAQVFSEWMTAISFREVAIVRTNS
jgi:hypothetical protein